MTDVKSRASRILKPISRFRDLNNATWPLPAPALPHLAAGEEVIGAYANDWDPLTEPVLFTTNAVYVLRQGSWDVAEFAQIERTIMPTEKTDVQGLMLMMRNQRQFWLPISGSKGGRFYDAFEVLRFIDRVLADRGATP